jgi:molecular chaperone HtpG
MTSTGTIPAVSSKDTFQVDLRGLVDLLSHHLYSSPDVFVRELLQNAVDAVTARRLVDPAFAGTIDLEVREPADSPPTLVVTDDGIGLTETDLHELLATIGSSSKRPVPDVRADFIGRFGIGLLACFLVADEITVVTRSALDPQAPALRWRGRADGTYDTAVLDATIEPGTRVHLRSRPGCEDQLSAEHVLDRARHYGGLLPVPIRLLADGGDVVEVNAAPPPWEAGDGLDYARDTFGIDPLDVVPLRADGVRGLAFVLPDAPSPSARPAHRVFLRRMLLTTSADRLLPDWAFFVRCVIDADDLRPTAARDNFRDDWRLDAVREQLGRCVRDHLVELARTDDRRLASIVATHHEGITALAVHDDECLRLFADWLPLSTSLGPMTLAEHTRRFSELRFVRRVDDFRQIAPIAAAQGRCVVNAGYVHLSELLDRLAAVRPELGIAALDPREVVDDFEALTADEWAGALGLVRAAETVLRPLACAVDARKFEPESLPVVYVSTDSGRFHRDLGRTRELYTGAGVDSAWGSLLDTLFAEVSPGATARLCLNLRNPVVQALAARAGGGAARVRRAVQLLYVQALLLGHHPLREAEFGLLNDVILGFVEEPAGDGR